MTAEIQYSLLDEALISTADGTGRHVELLSLPRVYERIVRGTVGDFPALRPHQRHVWHAFLVQVAALALHRAHLRELPDDAAAWRSLLLALTPDDPDGAAWALVTPHARPALLQPPVADGDVSAFKLVIDTPDALDVLVTSKNHDVKRSVVFDARPEHWLYALVSLQTQQGYLGTGNYGISRMNGGFSSRPGFGIAPPGGPGARVVRDVLRLLAMRTRILEENPCYPSTGGFSLLWLITWDGSSSLNLDYLDPFYVEVCRRVRMTSAGTSGARLRALVVGSTVARVNAKMFNGRTGDPWAPLIADRHGRRKSLTADAGSFTYKGLVPILFPAPGDSNAPTRAPLQEWAPEDPDKGLVVVATSLVRGQGKTEGLHERRIPVSKAMRPFLGPVIASDEGARIATQRVEDVGLLARKVLYPAVMAVFTAAPSKWERARDDETAKSRTRSVLGQFDSRVDATFFADLDAELAQSGNSDVQNTVRAEWLLRLRDAARDVLEAAAAAAPSAAMRHYRTRVRARMRFECAFRHEFGHRTGITPAAV